MVLPRVIKLIHSYNVPLYCQLRSASRSWIYKGGKGIDKGKGFSFTYTSTPDDKRQIPLSQKLIPEELESMRLKYPEFLPSTKPEHRNKIKTVLEHNDMLQRRNNIDIPEFYVGSILAVTVSDPNAAGKISRFLGICIFREGTGLNSCFTLRNIVDREGIEIRYDLYNPTIRSIEVIKLEKRLDQDLRYLRDAEPQYSTFPLDMEPELRKEGAPVPVNPIKVKMLPLPWSIDWFKIRYQHQTYGIEKMRGVWEYYYKRSVHNRHHNEYEQFDLMKEYRSHIPEDAQLPIWNKLSDYEKSTSEIKKKARRAKMIKR
uniref:Large ribosomal subunit protein bL19m n=2 Tax=Tetranychus urticae TaxID=32264 RepID=T1JQY3_TETUR